MPTQQSQNPMINKIIKDWVGEKINNKPKYPHSVNEEQERVKALHDLIEDIPQLTERIVENLKQMKIDIPYLAPTDQVRDDMKFNSTVEYIIKTLSPER